jgi:hypothetical protein
VQGSIYWTRAPPPRLGSVHKRLKNREKMRKKERGKTNIEKGKNWQFKDKYEKVE